MLTHRHATRTPHRAASLAPALAPALTALALLLPVACGGGEEQPVGLETGDRARVERTTEGNVTTVRNLAGSQWGGDATLEVELEIGVAEGDERYMFNQPMPRWMTQDAIYVLEPSDARVRVYGRDGEHRFDFGREGQGPGELENPIDVVVAEDGRIGVAGFAGAGSIKLSWFSRDGEFLEDWQLGQMGPGSRIMPIPQGMVVDGDVVWLPVREMPEMQAAMAAEPFVPRVGVQSFGPDGPIGEPWFTPGRDLDFPTYELSFRGMTRRVPVPYAVTGPVVSPLPGGRTFWGYPDEYHFAVEHPDGSRLEVFRDIEPVPVVPEEAEYRIERIGEMNRQRSPDATWSGGEIPASKPYFRMIVADQSGRIWVSREGPSRRNDPCTAPGDQVPGEPVVLCWEADGILDIFAPDGAFLGSLDRQEGMRLYSPFIDGDRILAGHEDEEGIFTVRVYRIVLPEGAAD